MLGMQTAALDDRGRAQGSKKADLSAAILLDVGKGERSVPDYIGGVAARPTHRFSSAIALDAASIAHETTSLSESLSTFSNGATAEQPTADEDTQLQRAELRAYLSSSGSAPAQHLSNHLRSVSHRREAMAGEQAAANPQLRPGAGSDPCKTNPMQFAAALEGITLDDSSPQRDSVRRMQERGRLLKQEVEHQRFSDREQRELKESERRRIKAELEAGLVEQRQREQRNSQQDAWDTLAAQLE